jgi:hypothetical protein
MVVNSHPLYRLSYWGIFIFVWGYIIQEQADVNNHNKILA